ncbi:MAG: MscS Mechanosensitive ion channel [Bryobacterales bacterium]|nr:MscS Mechanosensitive ion channel [Bryobacterales bacterium]
MSQRTKWVALASLLALTISCIALSWRTPDAILAASFVGNNAEPSKASPGQQATVNLQPWQTAEALAALAVSPEELEYAREAEHLADHEVDQAFGAALRRATLQKISLPPEAASLATKVAGLEKMVAEDTAHVTQLTARDPEDNLDVAKAQLALDTDQLTEAQKDVARAGGDQRGRIQEELATHEAAMHDFDTHAGAYKPAVSRTGGTYTTVAEDANAWFQQRTRYKLLRAAAGQSRTHAAALVAEHEGLEHAPETSAGTDKASHLASLRHASTRSELLGIYDDQIQTLQQLSATYDKWAAQVQLEHQMTGLLVLRGLGLMGLILIGVMMADELAAVAARRFPTDHRKSGTLITIVRLSIKLVGAVAILLVAFGRPSQLPTILGLATAGLTVALQDFIVASIGWFVLMGRNGMRVGDWVEINGVAGEVEHISLFRTSMLETGNAHNKGRQTGRRTTFSNSFAIRGQYFNFSTSGQWMWDEIRVSIPAGRDASSTIEHVRAQVLKETLKDAREAEQEWKKVSRHFAAEPAVDIRPGSSGIDMVVRYVTRAGDRFEVRNRLYHQILGLVHQSAEDIPAVATALPDGRGSATAVVNV